MILSGVGGLLIVVADWLVKVSVSLIALMRWLKYLVRSDLLQANQVLVYGVRVLMMSESTVFSSGLPITLISYLW